MLLKALYKCFITVQHVSYKCLHTYIPSNTSGAIQAALPLLLVIWVCASQAVPKSQIFRTVPRAINSRLRTEMFSHNQTITINVPFNFVESGCAYNFCCATVYQDWTVFGTTCMKSGQNHFWKEHLCALKVFVWPHAHSLAGTLNTITSSHSNEWMNDMITITWSATD